jgi:2'-hydroxyisoflavone reductase
LFNRGKTNPHLFTELEKLQGDRDGGLDALKAEVEKGRRWHAVVDTSGYVPRIVKDSATLLAAAADHYTFISSISVYADPSKIGLTEEDAVGVLEDASVEEVTGETYGPLKALCEEAAEEAFPGTAARIRPGLIVGPGDPTDRFTYWPVRASEGGKILAPGNPSDPVQFIDARDLAAWMVECIEHSRVGIFNATGPAESMSVQQMIEGCARGTRATIEPVWVDAKFLEQHEVQPWMHMTVWVPPKGEAGGMGAVDVRRAVEAGLSFRPVDEIAKDTLAWWREQEPQRRDEPRAGLGREREAEVIAAWEKSRTKAG